MKKHYMLTILDFAVKCKFKMALSVLCSLVSVAGGFIPYYAIYKLLILFFDKNAGINSLLFWCGISLLGYMGKVLFFGISTSLAHESAYTILESIRLSIARKLLKAPLGTVLNRSVGSVKNLMVDRTESIELPLAHVIPEGAGFVLVPLGVFVYLLSINWIMALAAIVTVPISFLVFTPAMAKMAKKYDGYMQSSNHMNSVIVEYIEGIEVIKTFNQSSASYEKYSKAVSSFLKYTLDWFKSTYISGMFMITVLPSTLAAGLPIGMYLYKTGRLTPAELTICIILSMGFIAPLMSLSTYMNALKMIKYAAEDLSEVLQLPELPDKQRPVEIANYNITFSHAAFSYENGEQALTDVNLHIPQGSYYALAGPSGGGKSTIARMVARFWDVQKGEVLIGKSNIKDIPLVQLSQMVSYVTQDNFLFNCSLKENIRLGNPQAGEDEVLAAARAARCDEFISKLPQGYDTSAGEAGNRLSGGEKQRIAIARMILKNAPIIILDEATAFTDPDNEAKIQQAIASLTKGKTLLVIAHRLSTIKDADRIVLIRNGTVDTQGTFEELMQGSDLFRDMWKAHTGARKWQAGSNIERDNTCLK